MTKYKLVGGILNIEQRILNVEVGISALFNFSTMVEFPTSTFKILCSIFKIKTGLNLLAFLADKEDS